MGSGQGYCPAECGHQREQLAPSEAWGPAHHTLQGGGWLGEPRMGPAPPPSPGSLLPPHPHLQSHPVPTLVTCSSHSGCGGAGIWGGGRLRRVRAAPALAAPPLPWGRPVPSLGPLFLWPLTPSSRRGSAQRRTRCPSESLSQTSKEKGRGRKGRRGIGRGGEK